jgi:hypothetical protein
MNGVAEGKRHERSREGVQPVHDARHTLCAHKSGEGDEREGDERKGDERKGEELHGVMHDKGNALEART